MVVNEGYRRWAGLHLQAKSLHHLCQDQLTDCKGFGAEQAMERMTSGMMASWMKSIQPLL